MQRGQDQDQVWPQDLNQDPLVGGPNDVDFTKFLELGNDFAQFETVEQQNGPSGLDTPMGRLTFGGQNEQMLTPQQQAMLQNMDLTMSLQTHMQFPDMSRQQSQPGDGHQYQQYPMYQHMHNPYQHQVPPTPVSAEMHAAKYQQAMDMAGHVIFERQNASFTPLGTPAQTPIDAWGIPDYVVADDFFSPLTSPAIEAQQHHYASTNTTSSPVDLVSEPPAGARKSRRKLNPTSRVQSARNVRSSVNNKITARRSQNSINASQNEQITNEAARPKHLLPGTASAVSSEDSVSPEPLSETIMRPPPVPQSRTPSALRPQLRDIDTPATPTTLMMIPGKQLDVTSDDHATIESPEIMEDISLPAAAADLPSRVLPELNTRLITDDEDSTPTISAKTPKLSADSTPRSAGAKTANNPAEILPKPRGGRMSKKRQSISQATVSPALRPKISPSISPLVPSTGPGMPSLSAETSALYLASKSNYQNIIDGTHLPGVSYPETLAENLSSKRTSHKIAEQGRRNRINLALKEIEGLLPPAIAAAGRKERDAKDENDGISDKPSASAGASKASTVEMAIIYIKSLQNELKETKDKLEAAEKTLAEGGGGSSGSQTSEQTNG